MAGLGLGGKFQRTSGVLGSSGTWGWTPPPRSVPRTLVGLLLFKNDRDHQSHPRVDHNLCSRIFNLTVDGDGALNAP